MFWLPVFSKQPDLEGDLVWSIFMKERWFDCLRNQKKKKEHETKKKAVSSVCLAQQLGSAVDVDLFDMWKKDYVGEEHKESLNFLVEYEKKLLSDKHFFSDEHFLVDFATQIRIASHLWQRFQNIRDDPEAIDILDSWYKRVEQETEKKIDCNDLLGRTKSMDWMMFLSIILFQWARNGRALQHWKGKNWMFNILKTVIFTCDIDDTVFSKKDEDVSAKQLRILTMLEQMTNKFSNERSGSKNMALCLREIDVTESDSDECSVDFSFKKGFTITNGKKKFVLNTAAEKIKQK